MRISDWSSDVCSSDLTYRVRRDGQQNILDLRPIGQSLVHRDRPRRRRPDDGMRAHQLGNRTLDDLERDIDLGRSEEHTSELQSLMRISYAVFCLKKKTIQTHNMCPTCTPRVTKS